MFNLFYVCINLSRCTVIPNSKQNKQNSLYVIVHAHKLELASRAFIQRNENEMKWCAENQMNNKCEKKLF